VCSYRTHRSTLLEFRFQGNASFYAQCVNYAMKASRRRNAKEAIFPTEPQESRQYISRYNEY
jgi:hypothetical protein